MRTQTDRFLVERRRMVQEQIRERGIKDERVLDAMLHVPRHLFVPEDVLALAYVDRPLPIGAGQTISQPFMVALMVALLHLTGKERVLEVGAGSGYQAAVLSYLAAEVHSMEFVPELADDAQNHLRQLGFDNVFVHSGDGGLGWPRLAPYQGIIVAAAAPTVPPALLSQLDADSRLVLPVGERGNQRLEIWQRRGEQFLLHLGGPVAFVPLRGAAGWSEEDWNASGEEQKTE